MKLVHNEKEKQIALFTNLSKECYHGLPGLYNIIAHLLDTQSTCDTKTASGQRFMTQPIIIPTLNYFFCQGNLIELALAFSNSVSYPHSWADRHNLSISSCAALPTLTSAAENSSRPSPPLRRPSSHMLASSTFRPSCCVAEIQHHSTVQSFSVWQR